MQFSRIAIDMIGWHILYYLQSVLTIFYNPLLNLTIKLHLHKATMSGGGGGGGGIEDDRIFQSAEGLPNCCRIREI